MPYCQKLWVYTVCVCHFVRNFGVRNFRTFYQAEGSILNNWYCGVVNSADPDQIGSRFALFLGYAILSEFMDIYLIG